MASKINQLFSDLTDEDLKAAINEMREDESSGVVRLDGWVRKLAKEMWKISGETNMTTHLFGAQFNLFREAAYRFLP